MRTSLKNAKVYRDGVFVTADIYVEDGRIVRIDDLSSVPTVSSSGDDRKDGVVPAKITEYDLTDHLIFPGLVDVHVHLREPGFSYKEDVLSGTMAAARGGYTDICPMPNLNPVPDSAETLKQEWDAIERKAIVNVHPYGSITKGAMGEEVSDMDPMATAPDGHTAVAFSDDGKGVVSDEVMRKALIKTKELGKLAAAHCEFKSLMGGTAVNDGAFARTLGIKGISNESEWKMIERDLALAKETGAAYHVCHVSTKESIDIIRRAKAEGVDVTCETGPHYLLLDDEMDIVKEADEKNIPLTYYKMNPPLRSRSDREAVVNGLLDGTVDMIATDHAPHSKEEKDKSILESPMGIVGLECAFPLLYTGLVETGLLSLERLVSIMTEVPAKRFGIESGIEVGAKANLSVWKLGVNDRIDNSRFLSKGRATPFTGGEVHARCVMTICNGRVVYSDMRQ